MILNVNEIVEKKIKELDESHVIETAIEKKIESVITQAVNDAFDWTFSRKISDKIREQIGDLAENIKLNSYNTLIADTVRNIIEADMNEDIAKKVQSKIKELLLVTEKTIKLSDIIEKFKSVNFDDEEEYSYSVTETDRKSFYGDFFYKKFSFHNNEKDTDKETWHIEFVRFNNGDWTVCELKYDESTIFSHSEINMLKHYDEFECLILRCMLNRIPVEIDMTAPDIEGELYKSFD